MMDLEVSHDQRQYRLMLERLNEFERNQIGIATLISDLSALLNACENAPKDWRNAFSVEWANLELVYAVALDQGATRFNDEDRQVIQKAVAELKKLVETRLKQPA